MDSPVSNAASSPSNLSTSSNSNSPKSPDFRPYVKSPPRTQKTSKCNAMLLLAALNTHTLAPPPMQMLRLTPQRRVC